MTGIWRENELGSAGRYFKSRLIVEEQVQVSQDTEKDHTKRGGKKRKRDVITILPVKRQNAD